MPTRCTNRTTSCAGSAQTQTLAAQQTLSAEDEPMRIYSNPIITTATTDNQTTNTDLVKILEQLSCQSQLLVDLLAAVNAMTAATLSLGNRG